MMSSGTNACQAGYKGDEMDAKQLVDLILDHTNSKGAIIVEMARSIRDETISDWGWVNNAISARWSDSIRRTMANKAVKLIEEGRLFG
jgi:hypothetical protein